MRTYIVEFNATVAMAVEARSAKHAQELIAYNAGEDLLGLDAEPSIMPTDTPNYKVRKC